MKRLPFLSAGAFFVLMLVFGIASRAEPPAAASVARGGQVFQYWCASCHGAGPGHPGTVALAAKYHGEPPALLEQRRDLTAATVKYYVRHGLSIMPVFRKTEVSDADLDDLAAYLAKSNR